jgi:hypothetical protein
MDFKSLRTKILATLPPELVRQVVKWCVVSYCKLPQTKEEWEFKLRKHFSKFNFCDYVSVNFVGRSLKFTTNKKNIGYFPCGREEILFELQNMFGVKFFRDRAAVYEVYNSYFKIKSFHNGHVYNVYLNFKDDVNKANEVLETSWVKATKYRNLLYGEFISYKIPTKMPICDKCCKHLDHNEDLDCYLGHEINKTCCSKDKIWLCSSCLILLDGEGPNWLEDL